MTYAITLDGADVTWEQTRAWSAYAWPLARVALAMAAERYGIRPEDGVGVLRMPERMAHSFILAMRCDIQRRGAYLTPGMRPWAPDLAAASVPGAGPTPGGVVGSPALQLVGGDA